MASYVVRWIKRRGVESPVVRPADADELRWSLGQPTAHEAVAVVLKHQRRQLERARESVASHERYIEKLERLLADVKG